MEPTFNLLLTHDQSVNPVANPCCLPTASIPWAERAPFATPSQPESNLRPVALAVRAHLLSARALSVVARPLVAV